ncbi:hypothetical protein HJ001_24220 [Vibrio parahaemolyticus]|uniref:hypothetical protein n=1 Tax=Vibrio alginolyticus TaxID=663 RepID=UPI00148CCFFC|nr:hypothetical protein [Vibrio alginolyticus]MBE3816780.1 hypothetical protein [Vibrio parahaemolyticus]MBE3884520.1 hypothetical protein [Vibrio parahaemolyticus]MBE4177754.1 hypothetical protein [Vibrio parahaemolyticus]MBE4281775.1 hypothetical protein [Vibrio parahaemolyticus]MBE4530769.1 hypothetical protein [Vibrio parahaemolyticus]
MPQRDLFVIKDYFEKLKKAHPDSKSDVDIIINTIEKISSTCTSIKPSITLPRNNVMDCNICGKTVIPND